MATCTSRSHTIVNDSRHASKPESWGGREAVIGSGWTNISDSMETQILPLGGGMDALAPMV